MGGRARGYHLPSFDVSQFPGWNSFGPLSKGERGGRPSLHNCRHILGPGGGICVVLNLGPWERNTGGFLLRPLLPRWLKSFRIFPTYDKSGFFMPPFVVCILGARRYGSKAADPLQLQQPKGRKKVAKKTAGRTDDGRRTDGDKEIPPLLFGLRPKVRQHHTFFGDKQKE